MCIYVHTLLHMTYIVIYEQQCTDRYDDATLSSAMCAYMCTHMCITAYICTTRVVLTNILQ